MGNYMSHLAWGRCHGDRPQIDGHLDITMICCWGQPHINWFADDLIVVKIPFSPDHLPIVAIKFDVGFQVLADAGTFDFKAYMAERESIVDDAWSPISQLIKVQKQDRR